MKINYSLLALAVGAFAIGTTEFSPMGLLPSMAEDLGFRVSIEAPIGLRIGYAKDLTLRGVKITAKTGEPLLLEDTVENLQRVE